MIEILIAIAAVVVAVCVPVGLALIQRMATNLDRVHARIDEHISNYTIHQPNRR